MYPEVPHHSGQQLVGGIAPEVEIAERGSPAESGGQFSQRGILRPWLKVWGLLCWPSLDIIGLSRAHGQLKQALDECRLQTHGAALCACRRRPVCLVNART